MLRGCRLSASRTAIINHHLPRHYGYFRQFFLHQAKFANGFAENLYPEYLEAVISTYLPPPTQGKRPK